MRQFCLAAEDQEGSANITCENTFKSVKTEESAIHLCAYPEEPSVAVAFQFIMSSAVASSEKELAGGFE